MTPEQARFVADDLIDEERAKATARRNAAAKPVPWYYRMPELDGLQPWERGERIAAARREVEFEWPTVLAGVVFAAACAGILWDAGLVRDGSLALWLVVSFAPVNFIRVYFVRRHLRRMLVAQGAGLPA
jgi:hypothetical protein